MKDIKLVEICKACGEHLTLMESIRHPEGTLWAVKRCLNCGSYPVEEVARLYDNERGHEITGSAGTSGVVFCDEG